MTLYRYFIAFLFAFSPMLFGAGEKPAVLSAKELAQRRIAGLKASQAALATMPAPEASRIAPPSEAAQLLRALQFRRAGREIPEELTPLLQRHDETEAAAAAERARKRAEAAAPPRAETLPAPAPAPVVDEAPRAPGAPAPAERRFRFRTDEEAIDARPQYMDRMDNPTPISTQDILREKRRLLTYRCTELPEKRYEKVISALCYLEAQSSDEAYRKELENFRTMHEKFFFNRFDKQASRDALKTIQEFLTFIQEQSVRNYLSQLNEIYPGFLRKLKEFQSAKLKEELEKARRNPIPQALRVPPIMPVMPAAALPAAPVVEKLLPHAPPAPQPLAAPPAVAPEPEAPLHPAPPAAQPLTPPVAQQPAVSLATSNKNLLPTVDISSFALRGSAALLVVAYVGAVRAEYTRYCTAQQQRSLEEQKKHPQKTWWGFFREEFFNIKPTLSNVVRIGLVLVAGKMVHDQLNS